MKTHTGLTCGRRNKELANFTDNGAFLPLKMLISRSLKCPYLHYKHCSPALRQRRSAVEAESCSAGFHAAKQKNLCIRLRLHLSTVCHVQILARIMKRRIPPGVCFSVPTKDKSGPNWAAIHIQKVLVLLALLSNVLYPEDLSTSQNHREFTK